MPKHHLDQDNAPIKAVLVHLGFNMWYDHDHPDIPQIYRRSVYRPYLRFDTGLWNDLVKRFVEAGMNMVVIDLGDGVKYESHPELAIRGSWTTKRLRRELARLRKLGLEPIPKLNFSACHDVWLGEYSRMLSTDTYYRVCKDLIAEVIELFDKPRLFHLGMDEEQYHDQEHYRYVVIRQYDLWWGDLYFLFDQVEAGGARPWIWSDYQWDNPRTFAKKMPRSVLQSNWYYGSSFSLKKHQVRAYLELERGRYDQVPTASNFLNDVNIERTVRFCAKHISPKRLRGFLITAWQPTLKQLRKIHTDAIDQAARALPKWQESR